MTSVTLSRTEPKTTCVAHFLKISRSQGIPWDLGISSPSVKSVTNNRTDLVKNA